MFERYAIFYTPVGALAAFGAAWLGWDSAEGCARAHPDLGVDAAQITATPRKYGLHGTIKAPFRLAEASGLAALQADVAALAQGRAPVDLGVMGVVHQGGFVALRPADDLPPLRDLARAVVTGLDHHRAPLSADDIARRRRTGLSARQDQQMLDWGYPFIFDDFHFHLTLSGNLDAAQGAAVCRALAPALDPLIAAPLTLDAITLMGEDAAGMFHQIHRYDLAG